MTGYLIDPALKLISSVEYNDDEIAPLLGCDLLAFGATFPDGDVLYVDDYMSNASTGFNIVGFGNIYGKALLGGSDKSGRSCNPKMTMDDLLNIVQFGQNPFALWYEELLSKHGIHMDVLVENTEQALSLPVSSIINLLTALPTSRQSEIKMMVTIDEVAGVSPMQLLKHFAKNMEKL